MCDKPGEIRSYPVRITGTDYKPGMPAKGCIFASIKLLAQAKNRFSSSAALVDCRT